MMEAFVDKDEIFKIPRSELERHQKPSVSLTDLSEYAPLRIANLSLERGVNDKLQLRRQQGSLTLGVLLWIEGFLRSENYSDAY